MSDQDKRLIKGLGAHGDGFVQTSRGPVFIAGALPGEIWDVGNGEPRCITPSPERQVPVCQHFEACGGCMAQHMPDALYRDWKSSRLAAAFARHGLKISIEPMQSVGVAARRRTTFAYALTSKGLVFGYHRAHSHEVVDIKMCPVLMPDLTSRLDALRRCAEIVAVPDQIGRLSATVVVGGLYVAITQDDLVLSKDQLEQLSACAQSHRLVQLAVNGEPIATLHDAVVQLPGADVVLTQPTFLQASPETECIIAPHIRNAAVKAKQAVDLFSGIGTFTFVLAQTSRVSAFDSDAGAIAGLVAGARNKHGLKPIEAKQRDLFREPLSKRELKAFDVVVINPPRAGADAQCQRLAHSTIAKIVMVACDPATLARDTKTLIDGGYQLKSVVPIDQFVFSEHLEVVAIFHKSKPR